MSYFETVIVLLIAAGLCGAFEQLLFGFSPPRFLFSVPVAFVGAVIGYLLVTSSVLPFLFGLDLGNRTIPVGWSLIIALAFSFIPRLLKYPQAKQGPIPPFEEAQKRRKN